MKKWFYLLLLLLPSVIYAQDKNVFIIKGHLSNLDNQPLVYAHIIVPNQHIGTISDTNGNFALPLTYGDTLMISHIGYMTRFIYFTENTFVYNNTIEIILLPQAFELKEVVITPFPKNWEAFKEAFVNLKLEEEPKPSLDLASLGIKHYVRPEDGFGVSAMGPVQALYNIFSKEVKSQKKLAALKQKDKFEKKIRIRYSEQLVSRLTGITDDALLKKFMHYCNLKDDYIIASSDYDLYLAIMDCYKHFTQDIR
jgi:hypothetical protein